jgi:diguanylate cyclase (GGDEF)-like protein
MSTRASSIRDSKAGGTAREVKAMVQKPASGNKPAARLHEVRAPSGAGAAASHAMWQAPERNLQRIVSSTAFRDQEHILAVLDVDHFRALKNMHGQGASESLLRAFGRRLEYEVSRSGGRVVRLGLDEFAVLASSEQCGPAVEHWAVALLKTACLPFSYRGTMFPFSASAGIATLSGAGRIAAEALRCARQAVTRSKQAGGGTVTMCSERELADVVERGELARDLSAAIASGQLIPFYQPVVALPSGKVTGMEVLARWMHPKHGLLEPIAFIQIAEEHGLCLALTRALLCQVVRDAQDWPTEWNFAFNITPNELLAVLDFIAASQHAGGPRIELQRIELEVTETAMMRDIELARRAVTAMQPSGVRVVLDDFGSGYANFKQLRQVPFGRLKIDKSFITDMRDDPRAEACAQAIIDLAHHLGMTATAEGVECVEVANRLGDMGCDHAQGYHFGRPMPAARIALMVADGPAVIKGTLEFAA